jgi:hypothetical protein
VCSSDLGVPAEAIDLEPRKEREELLGRIDDLEGQIPQNREFIATKKARDDP